MNIENKNGFKRKVVIIGIVILIIVIGFLCLQYSNSDDNQKHGNKAKESVVYITNSSKVVLNETNNTFVTNEKCNKSSIRTRYSLEIKDGKVLVRSIDTMENFIIDKISDATKIISLSNKKGCDNDRYIILTQDGLVFYSSSNINKISNVKNIEENFYNLNTALRFTSIMLGTQNGKMNLYAKTDANNLYKIDLR